MMYLLDTNTCIDFLRRRNAGVIANLQARPADDLRLCSVVLAELFFGALRSADSAGNMLRILEFAAAFTSLPFGDHAANIHAEIRADLAVRGTPIGPHDSQIAAIALTGNLTLVTANTAEFSRVSGLAIENWRT
jgi:tRNA(fMet)-specific endonuclease VapC